MSFQCCGRPRLSQSERAEHEARRRAYLARNGPQSAAEFDQVYGYGTSNACGRDISYYRQFEEANGDHCNYAHYADREQQIDQYRGLNCRHLRGWDKRMQRTTGGCCSYPGSCNGTLPYPYAQAQLSHCSVDAQQYRATNNSGCGGCADRPRYTWALDEPKRYPHTPYPAAYYMQTELPYGESPPTALQVAEIAARQTCANNNNSK